MSDEKDDEVVDVEIYEGPPDFESSLTTRDGDQEDDVPFGGGMSLISTFAASPTRDWKETLAWYRTHQTAQQIGFDPDGMCLKVCRTARNIPAKYLTAKQAQDATPTDHRVHEVAALRRGMVVYFDDPNDSNKAGHIVTLIGRVQDFDPNDLNDVLVETNSVKTNELVVVRATYFKEHWGDSFQFGATILNGVVLDVPQPRTKLEKFHDSDPDYKLRILRRADEAGRVKAGEALDRIITLVNLLPDNPKLTRVREVKNKVKDQKVLDMDLLQEAVEARGNRDGRIKRTYEALERVIDGLPDK